MIKNQVKIRREFSDAIARGFTLVEILIVVIILGILAAIVTPQFSNASSDARNSSVKATLQAVRTQFETFKIQHSDTPPQTTAMAAWGIMLTKSDTTETTVAAPSGTNFGPYLQQQPINPMLNKTGTSTSATDTANGWYYSATTNAYTFYARDSMGASITTW